MLTPLADVDPAKDRVVFVSHRWLRPWVTQHECEANGAVWAGAPHPDDADGTKFGSILKGVEELAAQFDWPHDRVSIWMDYACINQDDDELKGAGFTSVEYAAAGLQPSTSHASLPSSD